MQGKNPSIKDSLSSFLNMSWDTIFKFFDQAATGKLNTIVSQAWKSHAKSKGQPAVANKPPVLPMPANLDDTEKEALAAKPEYQPRFDFDVLTHFLEKIYRP